jgi:hypothetical protein
LPHDRDDFRRRTGQVALGLDAAQIEKWMTAAGMERIATRPLEPEADQKTAPSASATRGLPAAAINLLIAD